MEKLLKKPHIIKGGLAIDDRGQVTYINDFGFKGVKRFYMVENFSVDTIRAFHGHQKEAKYVFVTKGAALFNAVKLDNTSHPNKDSKVDKFILSLRIPAILFIPPGYAHGFRLLESKTKIIFFSTASLEESEKQDDYRFPYDYWGKDIWKVTNR
ncbi:dTDP-4-dehydrorhamnose 3,5-epimerase family protein [Patescibacteria group bacterium AH-259-L05]|nr:dTDP-4-dehydrorhamnose 3,5-epimerase family protein [Patescibacteria group bacterium AH-259-L05]